MIPATSSFSGQRTLLLLLRLRMGGGFRRRLQSLKSFKGMIFFLLTFFIYGFWIGHEASHPIMEGTQGLAHTYFPFALFCMCVITVATSTPPAIYFSPAEIHFLISRPFGQKALLLYKIGQYAIGALLSAVLVALVLPGMGRGAWASAIGTFQTMLFMQLFNVTIGLIGQKLSDRWVWAQRGARWIGIGLAGTVVLGLFVPMVSPVTWAGSLVDSTVGQLITSPFRLFAGMFTAETALELSGWALGAAALNMVLLSFILCTNVSYVEDAARTSTVMFQKWQRSIQHGRAPVNVSSTRWSLPRFPYCFGIGAIAWRQLTTALRTSGKSILAFGVMSLAAGPIIHQLYPEGFSWNAVGMLIVFSLLIVPRALLFDFRGDQDRLHWLKVLPMRPLHLALSQLAVPVILATSFHVLQLFSIGTTMDSSYWGLLAMLAIFALPFNLLLFAIENLLFLLFPTRLVPVGRMDFEFFGRSMVEFFLKSTALAFFVSFAGGLAMFVGGMTGSLVVAVLVGWTTAMLEVLFLSAMIGRSFAR